MVRGLIGKAACLLDIHRGLDQGRAASGFASGPGTGSAGGRKWVSVVKTWQRSAPNGKSGGRGLRLIVVTFW